MNRKAALFMITVLVLVMAIPGLAQAHGWEYRDRCRDCPEVWGEWGPGYGHRGPWMGPGYGYEWRGYGMWGPDSSVFGDTMSKGEAEKLVEWMLRRNPNLEVGKVTTVEDGYKIEVVTRKGKSLVDTLMVEKDTARVYPVYE